jgi:hypothetical protein
VVVVVDCVLAAVSIPAAAGAIVAAAVSIVAGAAAAGAGVASTGATVVSAVVVSVVVDSLEQEAANIPRARARAPNFTNFMMVVFVVSFGINAGKRKR